MGRNDDLVAVVTGGSRGTGELTKVHRSCIPRNSLVRPLASAAAAAL
jgi:hypothetical protein